MTQIYIDEAHELHDKFGAAIAHAWSDNQSDVRFDNSHEACHVARIVYGVPAGMVAAIKKLPNVQSAEVRGMFCHRSPFAFWDAPRKPPELERRELADLMVEVEVVRGGVTASRAMLVQVKMASSTSKWRPGVNVSQLCLHQRNLFHALPPFCVELHGRPTKEALKSQGVVTITAPSKTYTLAPYALAPLLGPQHPGGLIYAAVNPDHRQLRGPSPTQPWLAEDGRPQSGQGTASFTVDFARALAEMVVVDQTRFGVRTQPPISSSNDWSRLIYDLKDFAVWRAKHANWHADKVLDIELNPGKGPNNQVLYNVQRLVSHNGMLTGLCSHASSATLVAGTWTVGARRFDWLHEEARKAQHLKIYRNGDGPPFSSELSLNVPRSGFGILQVRVTVEPSAR